MNKRKYKKYAFIALKESFDLAKQVLFLFFLSTAVVSSKEISHDKKSLDEDIFSETDHLLWNNKIDSIWTLDKQNIPLKLDALIFITDNEKFKNTLGSIEQAKSRLNEVIPNITRSYRIIDP